MKKILLSILLLALLPLSGFAQGFIRGTIIDDETGEALIGATVVIAGTTNGAPTDLDGKYSIKADAGTYDLQVSYISYETQTITGVVVTDGGVTSIDVRMKTEGDLLEEIVVEAKALKNSESALLTIQKKSSVVLDGISSEQFSRNNDNDAASAIRRVTGVSLEGGKYVYVRGLGDRYSKTTVNGADIPGLDPNRNTVQMDLFPSNLIDNIIVYKTFRPDLPGDFTGGYVDITTKDFPEEFTLKLSGSLGYNTQATFNDEFLAIEDGSLDWIGLSGDQREIPAVVLNNPILDPTGGNPDVNDQLVFDQTSSFQNSFQPETDSPFFNNSFSASIGNQYTVFGKSLGFVTGFSYRRNYEFYTPAENGVANQWSQPQELGASVLLADRLLNDTRGTETVLLGGLASVSLKLNTNNKISFNFFRNQGSDKTGRFQNGLALSDDATQGYQTITSFYVERVLTSYQFKGEHNVEKWNNFRIEWLGAYTRSTQEEPDLRFFTFGFDNTDPNNLTDLQVQPSVGQIPSRYFRDLQEDNYNGKVDFTYPFQMGNGLGAKLKFGGSYLYKEREFRENQYRFNSRSGVLNSFDIERFFDDIWGPDNQGPTAVFIRDAFEPGNNYDADQSILGIYAMVDIPLTERFKVIAGVRFERTDLELTSFNDSLGTLDNNDFLPSLNMTYNLSDNMNLRFGYNRTLARPTFRELAPYTSFDFIGDLLLVGNPALDRSIIDNLDLRWELYPSPGEIISVSAFYKRMQDPIERVQNVEAGVSELQEVTFRNLPSADLFGVELELRKRLDFISPALKNFSLGANFTYINAVVDIPEDQLVFIRELNAFNTDDTRRLYGQAPYVVNAFATYQNNVGTLVNLAFYVNGERLSIIDLSGNNIQERPRPNINLSISQQIGRFAVRFSGTNLLNPEYKFTQDYNGVEYIFRNYQLGQTYSLGVSYTID